jgi:hypothetical protein
VQAMRIFHVYHTVADIIGRLGKVHEWVTGIYVVYPAMAGYTQRFGHLLVGILFRIEKARLSLWQ